MMRARGLSDHRINEWGERITTSGCLLLQVWGNEYRAEEFACDTAECVRVNRMNKERRQEQQQSSSDGGIG